MAYERDSKVIVLSRRRTRSPLAALRQRPFHRVRPPGAASPIKSTISDYELHAFVDNALEPARRERVQIFLTRHADAAADAAAYRRQNRLLRELRCERRRPPPAVRYLAAQLAHRLSLARGCRFLAWGAVAAVLVGTVAAAWDGAGLTIVPRVIATAGR